MIGFLKTMGRRGCRGDFRRARDWRERRQFRGDFRSALQFRCARGRRSAPAEKGAEELTSLLPTRIIVPTIVLAAALILSLVAGGAHAVLLTPPAKPGTFTLGATELWFHRDSEWTDGTGPVEDQFNLGAFWAKYGAHRRVTVFVEFAIWNGDPHREGTSYRHINLGVGANARIAEFEEFHVAALLNYFENFQHDNQETRCHSITRHWAALLHVGKTYPIKSRHEATVWWGPAFVKDEQIFDGGGCLSGRKESKDNWGLAAGANFLFWDHLELFGHVVWAGYLQPRLGIGYQF